MLQLGDCCYKKTINLAPKKKKKTTTIHSSDYEAVFRQSGALSQHATC